MKKCLICKSVAGLVVLYRILEGKEVAVESVSKIGPFVYLSHHEQFCFEQVEIVLFVLKRLRNLHDRPLQLREGVRSCLEQPLSFRYHVMVNSHQFLVSLYQPPTVLPYRIVEQTHILQIRASNTDSCELVVMQVQNLELREGCKLKGDFGELVGGEVQLDERDALVDSGQFVRADVGACQDEQLETGRILYELAYLKLLLEGLPHAVI